MTVENPFEPKPKANPGADITRTQQTVWIVGALVAIAVGWVVYTEKANARYPWDRCWTQACELEAMDAFTDRLNH